MAIVLEEICLYSNTPVSEIADCPWRNYLDSLGYPWRDLVYYDEPGAEATVQALSSWVSADRKLYVTDFPFVMYKRYDTDVSRQYPDIIIHKTIDSLKSDMDLNKNLNV